MLHRYVYVSFKCGPQFTICLPQCEFNESGDRSEVDFTFKYEFDGWIGRWLVQVMIFFSQSSRANPQKFADFLRLFPKTSKLHRIALQCSCCCKSISKVLEEKLRKTKKDDDELNSECETHVIHCYVTQITCEPICGINLRLKK